MSTLAGCTSFGEFKSRNCFEQPVPDSGLLNLQDLKVHHYPFAEEDLPADIRMRLEQCHNTDRFAVTV